MAYSTRTHTSLTFGLLLLAGCAALMLTREPVKISLYLLPLALHLVPADAMDEMQRKVQ